MLARRVWPQEIAARKSPSHPMRASKHSRPFLPLTRAYARAVVERTEGIQVAPRFSVRASLRCCISEARIETSCNRERVNGFSSRENVLECSTMRRNEAQRADKNTIETRKITNASNYKLFLCIASNGFYFDT